MGGVPSVPRDRSRTLQVIGAGYSRTGTMSMAMALETLLDGPVLHGGTQLLGREDGTEFLLFANLTKAYAKLWVDIFANRHNKPLLMKLLRKATAGFVAMTDAPTTMFARELAELYPDAKIVLVERDPARWFKSMEPLIKGTHITPWMLKLLLFPCPTWRWAPYWLQGMGESELERFSNREEGICKEHILRYNAWVRKAIPSDRLFTMEIKQGWEPLCKFLDKPVPKEPFPRANDADAAEAFSRNLFQTALLAWLGILSSIGLLVWTVWSFW